MMHIGRPFLILSATVAVIATAPAAAGQPALERSGPWAFTQPSESGGTREMAATPAAEDNSIWLLLVCDHSEVSASLMHSDRFPYPTAFASALILRFSDHLAITAQARYVSENQLAIEAAASMRLMRLLIDNERLAVTMTDDPAVAYTFSLQPNGRALAGLVGHCWNADQ